MSASSVEQLDTPVAMPSLRKISFLKINGILLFAAFLRLSSIVALRSFLHPNTWEFGQYATSLLAGKGYSFGGVPSAYMPPAYGFLLAGFLAVFGPGARTYLLLEILQAASGVLLVYVVYLLARQLYSVRTASVAALLVTLYPPFIQACNEFHPISFYLVLGVAAVYFLVRAVETPRSWPPVLAAGVCMGLLVLFRAEALGLAFLFAIFLCFLPRRQSIARGAAFLALVVAIILPWTLRNYRVFHAFVPVSTSAPLNLWIGHNPNATGSDRIPFGYVQATVPPAMLAELQAIPHTDDNELLQGKVFQREAVAYIRSHPRQEVALFFRKVRLFWTFDPNHEKGRKPAFWVPSILLSLFALIGLFAGEQPAFRQRVPLLLSIGFSFLVGLVFFVLPRYKITVDPLLCVFAANGVLASLAMVRGRSAR